jgi:hypothetical protein
MKIIKRGSKNMVAYRGTCQRCGSVMEEESGKLTIEVDQQDSFAHAQCPVCKSGFVLYPTKDQYKPLKRTKH